MRNIPIPIDTARLTFVCVTPPRPRVANQETGEIKTDKNGRTIYQVGLSAADLTGRAELVNVNIPGEPKVNVGQVVDLAGLVGFAWEQTRGGQTGGASPTAPSPSPPPTPSPSRPRKPPDQVTAMIPVTVIAGGALAAAAAGALAWRHWFPRSFWLAGVFPFQCRPHVPDLGSRRLRMRAHPQAAPLAVEPGSDARHGSRRPFRRGPRRDRLPPPHPPHRHRARPAARHPPAQRARLAGPGQAPRRPGPRRLLPRRRTARPRLARPRGPRHRLRTRPGMAAGHPTATRWSTWPSKREPASC